jgi:hypothetical protein
LGSQEKETDTQTHVQWKWGVDTNQRMWTRQQATKTKGASKTSTWGLVAEGTRAIVMKGTKTSQIGELVTIVKKCAVMVQVQFSADSGEPAGMKRPESLIMLEEGLEVRRDRKGYLWVTRRETTPPVEKTPPEPVSWAHVIEEVD